MCNRLLLIAVMGTAMACVVLPSGCKRGSGAAARSVAVSPVGNDEKADDGDDVDDVDDSSDPRGAAAPARPQPAARRDDGDDWRKADEKKTVARVVRRHVRPAAGAVMTKRKEDETPDQKAERLAKEATLRSVDAALRGASALMKRCYDQVNAKAGSATLSFRVHRSGYVLSPSVSGVDPRAKSCIEGTLKRLRVSGVKASLNVTRTLRFRRF